MKVDQLTFRATVHPLALGKHSSMTRAVATRGQLKPLAQLFDLRDSHGLAMEAAQWCDRIIPSCAAMVAVSVVGGVDDDHSRDHDGGH